MAIQQGTDEWRQARAGKITASRIVDMLAKPKVAGEGMRANYAADLVCERLTGKAMPEGFKSDAMSRGTEVEPLARSAYEWVTDSEVKEVGFVIHPRLEFSGCSPDGLVGLDGLVQIKCPLPAEHLRTLMGKEINRAYILQMQWEMACTRREWCDFVSFHPNWPANLQLHVIRVHRNDDTIAEIELAARLFDNEINATVEKLRGR